MKSTIMALLLGGAGLAMTGAASAADLGAIPLRGSVGMWTGYYAGVNGGYSASWTSEPVMFNGSVAVAANPSGGVLGGQVGYNWQMTPEWVFGVETDLDWANVFGSQSVGRNFTSFIAQQRVNALGTLRGRVGYSLENILLYGTGGVAYGETEIDSAVTAGGCGPVGFCSTVNAKQWMFGWAAGVGFDWAFLPQWSFRTEYLHYDLGARHQDLTDPRAAVVVTQDTSFRGDLVRGAINFKFF